MVCRHADRRRLHIGESLCGTLIFRRAVVGASKHNSLLNVQRLIVFNVNDTDSPNCILAAQMYFNEPKVYGYMTRISCFHWMLNGVH